MEGRTCRWMLMAMAIALLCAIANAQNVDNIDILEPIIRYSPASAEDLFGFSTVLHQVSEPVSGDVLAQTVQRTRIIVGAPRGTFPGGLQLTDPGLAAEDNTGLVYMCPVGPGQCEGVRGPCNADDSQPICSIDDDRDGNFDGRLFDQAPNAEARPSCSASGTAQIEIKEGQFMGSTLFSDGDTFVACAPLWGYTVGQTTQNQPRGRCYWSDRDLQDFHYLQPCVPLDRGASTAGLFSYCMSGWGVTVVDVAGTRLFAVGNPGQETYRGFVSFRDENYLSEEIPMPCPDERPDFTFSDRSDTLSDILQGFQVVSGYITGRRGTGTANVIASEPRYDGIIYFGRVAVFVVDDNPSLTGDRPVPENITAEGEQLGEFFGYSMVAADLNGDGWDELVVGAPMYTKVDAGDNGIERGRLYVFLNTGGNLSATPIILENMVMRGRFGTSVVNLGDVDNDGNEDIAIGAPYVPGTGNNTGAVYVYYGRDSLDTFGQQTPYMIDADSIVNSVDGLNELQTFGFSLGSGVDVDGNGYNDLVVGAYQSQAVVLLRALPVADIYVWFEGQAEPVEFDQNNCNLNGVNYPCFTVTISANYSGRQLSGDRGVIFTVTEEVLNNERRLIFDSPSNDSAMVTITISDAMVVSQNLTVYSMNLEDLQNPASLIQAFRLQVTPEEIFRPAPVGVDGNQIISDFSAFPRIRTNGITQAEVQLGSINIAAITVQFSQSSYTVSEDEGTVVLMVQKVGSNAIPLEVSLTVICGSASGGIDFQITGSFETLVVPPGGTQQLTVPVLIIEDEVAEGTEFFEVTIGSSDQVIVGTLQRARVEITDNDVAELGFTRGSLRVLESDGTALVTVQLQTEVERTITVRLFTQDNHATAPSDYTAVERVLTFDSSTTSATVPIEIVSDDFIETDERFFVRLQLVSPQSGVVISRRRTKIIIETDDVAELGFTRGSLRVLESDGTALVTVQLQTEVERTITVRLFTQDDQATAPSDYTAVERVLTFDSSTTSATIPIEIVSDDFIEADERFFVRLQLVSPQSGVVISQRRTKIIIETDDDCPELGATVSEKPLLTTDPLAIQCVNLCFPRLRRLQICPNRVGTGLYY